MLATTHIQRQMSSVPGSGDSVIHLNSCHLVAGTEDFLYQVDS